MRVSTAVAVGLINIIYANVQHITLAYSNDEDMIMLMRLDNGLNLRGIESHVFRPIITAFILS